MQVNQSISILFYLKKQKMDSEGQIPIYCRLTIDGLSKDVSTGIKIKNDQWDGRFKRVNSLNKSHKVHNKRPGQLCTDLERHFDLVVAKAGVATPNLVLESFKSPINATQLKIERMENEQLSVALDDTIKKYLSYIQSLILW